MLARANALWRRVRDPSAREEVFELHPYRIDVKSRRIEVHGNPVEVTDKEFDLGLFLFSSLGHVLHARTGHRPGRFRRTVVQDIPYDDALVAGDRTLLGTAILNLLTNAINYAPGGTHVTISLRQCEHNWVISIRDQGSGIPAQVQCERFQRYR